MNKNTLYRLYSAALVGICLVPSVLMPFIKPTDSKEKRKLADKPQIKNEDGSLNFGFFDDFDSYFSEHFAFRQQLVTADGRLKATLLGTSPNSNVIVGKDGWLYYKNSADDFLNINTISKRAINNIRHNLDLVERYCQQNNIEFIVTVIPNKNTIYPEYMPFNYVPADAQNNLGMLTEKLSDTDYFLDMRSVLSSAQSNIPLYHKTDTHWNNLGAYVGHSGIMSKLGREVCPVGSSWTTKNDRLGDVAAMIYPSENAKDTQVYNDYEFRYQYQGRFKALDDVEISTVCENGQGSLTMYRDSFGEAILPYMAECFADAQFIRNVPYTIDGLSDRVLIIEIVERNLVNLQKYAPLMSAPQAELPENAETISGAIIKTEKNGSYMHIFGELPENITGDDITVYVTAEGVSYEAFNCFEDRLFGCEGTISDRGFSLYIADCEGLTPENVTISAVKN